MSVVKRYGYLFVVRFSNNNLNGAKSEPTVGQRLAESTHAFGYPLRKPFLTAIIF